MRAAHPGEASDEKRGQWRKKTIHQTTKNCRKDEQAQKESSEQRQEPTHKDRRQPSVHTPRYNARTECCEADSEDPGTSRGRNVEKQKRREAGTSRGRNVEETSGEDSETGQVHEREAGRRKGELTKRENEQIDERCRRTQDATETPTHVSARGKSVSGMFFHTL
ncbi:putative protein kinase domain protein [Toxoplasma gondii MAS]|uniref:Uncharacterized protein n=1 Tax=Toxoplasma gondii MAS TaxID=943118 RepID=A0A086QY03_TOXGO|nr:putative protein kinase domain protein [Toxoplasma gondii MAS]